MEICLHFFVIPEKFQKCSTLWINNKTSIILKLFYSFLKLSTSQSFCDIILEKTPLIYIKTLQQMSGWNATLR